MAKFNRFSGYEYVEAFADGKFLADQKGASSYHETGSKPVLIKQPVREDDEFTPYQWKALGSEHYHQTAIARDIANVKKRRG